MDCSVSHRVVYTNESRFDTVNINWPRTAGSWVCAPGDLVFVRNDNDLPPRPHILDVRGLTTLNLYLKSDEARILFPNANDVLNRWSIFGVMAGLLDGEILRAVGHDRWYVKAQIAPDGPVDVFAYWADNVATATTIRANARLYLNVLRHSDNEKAPDTRPVKSVESVLHNIRRRRWQELLLMDDISDSDDEQMGVPDVDEKHVVTIPQETKRQPSFAPGNVNILAPAPEPVPAAAAPIAEKRVVDIISPQQQIPPHYWQIHPFATMDTVPAEALIREGAIGASTYAGMNLEAFNTGGFAGIAHELVYPKDMFWCERTREMPFMRMLLR